MNITEQLIKKQTELMEKYHEIESELQPHFKDVGYPVDINSRLGQAKLKETAWRVTEELMEATQESFLQTKRTPQSDAKVIEEYIDALHFLVEFCILSGIKFETDIFDHLLDEREDFFSLNECTLSIIFGLGMACHELKNKPWKQTLVPVEEYKFHSYIRDTIHSFTLLMSYHFDLRGQDLLDAYLDKANINKRRQQEGY